MSTNKKIRLATEADVTSILEIYLPFIAETVITFEYEVPTLTEFSKRMANIQKKYPWIVCEVNGAVVGYAYASQFNERAAYDWSIDFSIYIRSQYHRQKIGKALYFTLCELLKLQGYYNAYAGIAMPNIKSESFHQSFGFMPIGVYHNVGYKFGDWRDVKWFELRIQDYSQSPLRPQSIDEINNTFEFRTIIQKAEQMISEP
ncbi:MAG: N-acetyltransferase family protein [Negativicutes bacterium]